MSRRTQKDYTKDIVEYPQEEPEVEDSLSVYRDMFTKTEEERLEEEDIDTQTIKSVTDLNITKKTNDWTDNPNNIKFNVGQLVVVTSSKTSDTVYKVVGFDRDYNTYMIKASLSEYSYPKSGLELKEAPEGAEWEKLILDPYKKWKAEQEKKMENKKIDKICIMVEIDGEVCLVNLADNVKRMLPGIIQSLSPDKYGLEVIKLSNKYKFEDITEEDVSG